MPMPSAPFLLGGPRIEKPVATARSNVHAGAAGEGWARAICQNPPAQATGSRPEAASEVPVAGALHPDLIPGGIEQPHLLAVIDRTDRGDRQREFGREGSNRRARLRWRGKQQLVIVAT